jgi:hypothetical protein
MLSRTDAAADIVVRAADAAAAAPAETDETSAHEEPDFATADALAGIRAGQHRLREYRARALAMTEVDGVVTRKVLADYDSRCEEMEQRAAPLVQKVREEHARLRRVVEKVRRRDEEARLLEAEAALRHAVGEIDSEELGVRTRGPQETRSQCAERLAALQAAEERFVAALEPEAADNNGHREETASAMVGASGSIPPSGGRAETAKPLRKG